MDLKRYGLLLERPKTAFSSFSIMIESIIKNNLIPIIIFQDGLSNNNYQNVYNKIDHFRNKYPQLREDNFLIIEPEYNIEVNRSAWKRRLKEKVISINNYAFGTNNVGVSDKLFIVNLNNIAIIQNNLLLISNQIDNMLADLLNIADVSNIKSLSDDKFDPYINILFKDRSFDEILYDDSLGNTFYNKIKTIPSSKAYIRLEDPNYIEVINKYNLGSRLYSTFAKPFKVENKDLEAVINFTTNSGLKLLFNNSSDNVDDNSSLIKIES